MQNVLVSGDKRTTITASGCQHIAEHSLHTCTWYDCEILIVVSSMMVSHDDAKADGQVWRCNSQCKCCFLLRFMSHHVTWWFYRSAGKWCYYLLPLLIGTMFAPAEVVNILSPCSKCVHDLCRIPTEAKRTTRQMRWWLNQLPSSRWKSWISWLAQTPSCRRHGWQVGFEPPVLLWRLILVSKPYEFSGSGTGSERISG